MGGPIDGFGGISSNSAGLLSEFFFPSCLHMNSCVRNEGSDSLIDLRLPLTWLTGISNVPASETKLVCGEGEQIFRDQFFEPGPSNF